MSRGNLYCGVSVQRNVWVRVGVSAVVNERVVSSEKGPAIRTRIKLSSKAFTGTSIPSNTSAKRFRTIRLHSNRGHCLNGNIRETIRGVGDVVSPGLYYSSPFSRYTVSDGVVRLSNARGGRLLNTGTVLTMSLTYTGTTTGGLELPLFHCVNKACTIEVPIPVVGVLGNNTRTSGGVSVRRFVVVPINTEYFSRKVVRYYRVCRALNGVLGRGGVSANVNSRNNCTPDLGDSRSTVRCVVGTVRGANCAASRVGVTLSTTSSR